MNDGTDDSNVVKVKGQRPPSLMDSATTALNKARKDSYEAKMKTIAGRIIEHKKALKLATDEADALQKDFDEGM